MTGQTRREGVPTHPKARAKESRPEKGSARTGAARTGAARTRSRGEGAAPRPGFRLLILQLLSHSVKTLFTHFLRKGHTVRKASSVSPEKACWPLSQPLPRRFPVVSAMGNEGSHSVDGGHLETLFLLLPLRRCGERGRQRSQQKPAFAPQVSSWPGCRADQHGAV